MIRELIYKDYEDYIELLRQLTDIGEVTQYNFIEYIVRQGLSTSSKTIVLELDNKLVGCVSMFLERKLKGNTLHIEDVVTHKDYRGKGIGAELMEYCKQYAKENNCYKIVLDCSEHNVAFYEKCGFKNTGTYMSIKY